MKRTTMKRSTGGLRFVVQKHAASALHFDFRLEIDGVMKSWAVPKGPSLDPAVKRLAMEVEDHPVSYNTFEGTIPGGQYGGGTVMLWDRGTYAAVDGGADALRDGYAAGKLDVVLHGERLRGAWALVRTRKAGSRQQWLLIKRDDAHADRDVDIVAEEPTSIASGRTMDEIAGGARKRAGRKAVAKKAVAKTAKEAVKKTPVAAPKPNARGVRAVRAADRAWKAAVGMPVLEPMYASVGTAVPEGGDWTFEPKYDGVRVLALATADAAQLVTRNGNDKAAQFPEIVDALCALARQARRALVLDGEIVALVDGEPARFQALQGRMHLGDATGIAGHAADAPATLVAFDLLVAGDDSLLDEPWTARRARLEKLLGRTRGATAARVQLGETVTGDGAAMVARARARGWEGVIAKRTDAPYTPGQRARHWLKLKVEHRQEFVVGGYTEPRNTREHIGALLLGYFDDEGRLVYAGHAGGGFTREGLRDMARRLAPLERKTSPFATPPRTNEPAHWVRPSVVVEVKFIEWTEDQRLRQPIFVGVRDDKPARSVGREAESVQAATKKAPARKSATSKATSRARETVVEQLARIEAEGGDGTVRLGPRTTLDVTNLDKVYFPDDGVTKGDVMRYYATVAPYVLPVIADRPLVLRRYPNGIDGKAFFQHRAENVPPGVRTEPVDADGDGQSVPFLVGGDLATVLYTVQLGAISVDPWHARVGALDAADYTVLDLDPGPKAPFARVVDVARWIRAELDALGLHAALKTSGSRGLHIALPLPSGTSADTALAVAEAIATRVAAAHPKEATVERSVRARSPGAVYVDYLQNIPGKTVAGAYAVRARQGAKVSTPLAWEELDDALDPAAFTLRTVPARLERVGDLWRAAMRKPNPVRALRAVVPTP